MFEILIRTLPNLFDFLQFYIQRAAYWKRVHELQVKKLDIDPEELEFQMTWMSGVFCPTGHEMSLSRCFFGGCKGILEPCRTQN